MRRLYRILPPAILVLLLFQPLFAAEPRETKRVLVFYSEDKAHPAHELTDQGIRTAFRSNKRFNVQLYTEYLDLSRFGGSGHAHAVANYLKRKYASTEIDAIIAVYAAAMDILINERRDKVFPGVPIVACEITRDTAEKLERSPWRRMTTGVVIGDNATDVLEDALRLRPGTRSVALVAGTAPNDAHNEFYRALESYAGRVELIDLTKLPMQETLARVGSLPPDTIILYSSIFRDGAGQIFVPREALSLISAAANQPVFGLYDSYVGYGIVGGRLMSFEQQGREAATLTLRVLAGESPASIPFGGEQAYVSVYDWRELKRWKIPESALPPGSVIRYRVPTFWEEHRGPITGVVSLIIIETALILGLLINFQRRRRAEHALREHENELMALTGRLIHTQEEELRRLSRDLHDDLTQRLAVLAIDTGMLEKAISPLHPEASQELADLKTKLIEASDEVHALSRQLHPSILEDLGLVQAVQSECDIFSRRTGITVSFEAGDFSSPIPHDIALCLYRVLQEGLQNISKHSKAVEARVVLGNLSGGIRLSIQDSGAGFDVKQAAGKAGIGLSSMRERVRLVNGTLSVVSEPGKGTKIEVFVPLGGNHVQVPSADRR
jgi:signal transduction histidine kinase